jgi:aminopeptidase
MFDPRFDKMAQVMVNYSIAVKPGQTVYVWGLGFAAQPLLLALYKEILKAGGNAFLRADVPGAAEIFYEYAQGEQLDFVSPVDRISVEQFDAYIRIGAETNTRRLTNADPAKIVRQQAAMRPILGRRMERSSQGTYNWCVTQFPTDAAAMEADMSLAEYAEFVFAACLVNDPDPVARWREISAAQQRYVDFLKGRKVLRAQGANIDLTMDITDRMFANCDGRANYPDGEICTTPIEDSANGWVRYSYPTMYNGRLISGVQLWFEKGRVVKATAERNEDMLIRVLDLDEGVRGLGEFAIGTNFGIQKFTHNTLFDEKIGGTIHLAVGSGGNNRSAIHWDMVTGMQEGTLSADGATFYQNGKFLI